MKERPRNTRDVKTSIYVHKNPEALAQAFKELRLAAAQDCTTRQAHRPESNPTLKGLRF